MKCIELRNALAVCKKPGVMMVICDILDDLRIADENIVNVDVLKDSVRQFASSNGQKLLKYSLFFPGRNILDEALSLVEAL